MLGYGTLNSDWNASAGVVVSRRSTPRNTTPRGDHCVYAVFSAGCSSWQGPHQDAQKISTTGRPRNDVMLTSFPASVGPPDAVTCDVGIDASFAAPHAEAHTTSAQPIMRRLRTIMAAPPPRSSRRGHPPRTSECRDTAGR